MESLLTPSAHSSTDSSVESAHLLSLTSAEDSVRLSKLEKKRKKLIFKLQFFSHLIFMAEINTNIFRFPLKNSLLLPFLIDECD